MISSRPPAISPSKAEGARDLEVPIMKLRDITLVQGVIIPKHFLEYSVLIGGSANSTLGFRSSTTSYGKVELSCLGIITPDTKYLRSDSCGGMEYDETICFANPNLH